MTRKQKIELCRLYNNSDIAALEYMKPFCNSNQKSLVDKLIAINTETDAGWGDTLCPGSLQDEYYEGKWQLLNSFGITSINGDASFEGVIY